jgi:hypothetical protein
MEIPWKLPFHFLFFAFPSFYQRFSSIEPLHRPLAGIASAGYRIRVDSKLLILNFYTISCIIVEMAFEFDSEKSKSNSDKHGIDFTQAERLWENPKLELLSKNPSEVR